MVQAGRVVITYAEISCSHASQVVFFVLNAYYPNLGKKGGVRTPPFFPKFRTPFSIFRTKGGWSGGLERIYDFQISFNLGI